MKTIKLQQDKINTQTSISAAGKAVMIFYSLTLKVFIFC